MAELTNLETKLGEVIGLAMAAQATVDRVEKLNKDRSIAKQLKTMRSEAALAEKQATELAGSFDGKKRLILGEARTVKKKGGEMLKAYLERNSDALDGFEFITMAEAGEVGHWQVLDQMGKDAKHAGVRGLVKTHLPIQKRHLKEAMAATMVLAAKEDPNAAA